MGEDGGSYGWTSAPACWGRKKEDGVWCSWVSIRLKPMDRKTRREVEGVTIFRGKEGEILWDSSPRRSRSEIPATVVLAREDRRKGGKVRGTSAAH